MSQALRLLNEYRNASDDLDALLNRISGLVDKLHSFSRPFSPAFVASSAIVHDKMAQTVVELEVLTLEMGEAVDFKADAKRHTEGVIKHLHGRGNEQWERVLTLRYIKLMSWRAIGAVIGVPHPTVIRWHDNAVGVLDGLLLQNGPPMC